MITVEPHLAIQARIAALRAAVELRAGADTPAAIVARAKEFEAYVLRDNAAPLPTGEGSGAAPPAGQATGPRTGQKQGNPRV